MAFTPVATWGGPSTPFQLAGQPPIERKPASDRLWDYANEHLGFHGFLRVANTRIADRTGIELLDLSDRDWRSAYGNRTHPHEAADDAIENEAPGMGCGI